MRRLLAIDPWKWTQHGFTLIELILVVFILGTAALLVAPRLSSFGAGSLKGASRHFAGLIQYIAQESSVTKQSYRLYYDLRKGAYWVAVGQEAGEFVSYVETSDPLMGRRLLPKGISFEDVITAQQGRVTEGEAFTQFYPVGVDKSLIHLREGEERWTLEINPLTGGVRVYSEYRS